MLDWESTYAVVLALMDAHPDAVLDDVGLHQLFQWIIVLPDFADDPLLANDAILNEILRVWYEESNA